LPRARRAATFGALAACGDAAEDETTYETDIVDESGGELIVREADEPGVEDVDIPDTPMTPVAPGDEAGETPEPAPAAD
jgi:hypothetical protein